MTDLVHGRPSTYNNHKCRCPECTAAWAEYIRERGYVRRYQQRKREEKQVSIVQIDTGPVEDKHDPFTEDFHS